MKTWWAAAFGVVGGLLGAGMIYLASSQPRGEAVTLSPPPSPAPVVVHVAGAVAHPGVYSLPVGCRVKEAIETAGGLLAQADTQALNLAAAVQDGERIFVPARAPTRSPPQAPAAGTAQDLPDWQYPTPTSGLTNINTALQGELEDLPNIGPVTAQKIIAYRESHGPFTSIEAIQDVPGIGPKTFEAIKDLITVGG